MQPTIEEVNRYFADPHAVQGPLVVELDAPAVARVGGQVPFVLRLRNPTAEPTIVGFGALTPDYDIQVIPGAPVAERRWWGAPAWNRMHNRVRLQAFNVVKLRPGEVREYRYTWDGRANGPPGTPHGGAFVVPGRYSVHGVLFTAGGDLTTSFRKLILRP